MSSMATLLSTLRRWARHLWLDERASRRWLDDAAAERLRQRIAAGEAQHLGEVRICVEASLPLAWLWPPPADEADLAARIRRRAVQWFARLHVWDTEANAGVLIYVLLAERVIEIVADRTLARQVPPAQWDDAVQALQQGLRAGTVEAALTCAVDTVHGWLLAVAPATSGHPNPNELPDAVVRV